MKWARVLLSFFLLQFSALTYSQVVLTDSLEEFDLTNDYYDLLEDKTARLSFQELFLDTVKTRFLKSKEEYDYISDTTTAYWLRFDIRNQSSKDKKWVLELLSVHSDDVRIFVLSENGKYHEVAAGMGLPFYSRTYKVSNLVFDLPGYLNQQTVFVRIHSRHIVGFEFKIRSQSYFTSYAVNEYYYLGFYYGILFIMAIYNFLLYFNFKERTYIYYTFYVFSCMLLSFTEDGYGFQFLWSSFPSLNYAINNYLSEVFFLISFVLYATSFLDLRKTNTLYFKTVVGLSLLYLIVEVIFILFPIADTNVLYILPFIAVYVSAVQVYRKGYKAARFFILGYSFVLLSIIILQLREHQLLGHNLFTVYSFNFGILLEVVVLSFALGDRIKMMKEEKVAAQKTLIQQLEENQRLQNKVNKELEEKVKDRTKELNAKTIELEEANDKLKKFSEELNVFASKLDKDNWELNKRIVEETKARMISKELTLDEFSKIFPTDFTCMKYLEEHKWSEGFSCKKCSNTKFSVTTKLHSRKCSKCNYIESATSSTVFHGIKFPIHKAFYIAYLTTSKNTKFTVDELADTLQLNRLTCWKFRKKILDRETEIKKKSNLNKLDSWEVLLKDF